MEPIRVLHIVGKMHRAGLETFIMNIYRTIDRTKVQFDFITHYCQRGDYDDEIERMGGKIYRFSVMEDKNLIRYFKELNRFFKKHTEYRVVHGHWTTFGLFYMYFAKKNGVQFRISHAHSSKNAPGLRGKFIGFLIRPMKRLCNYHFACSINAAYWLYGKKYMKKNAVTIINNAIDSKRFSFNEEIRNIYRKNMKLDDKFIIGNIGRLHYCKNQSFLLDVFKEISVIKENAVLLIIGEGRESYNLKKKAKDLKIDQKVFFLGVRSDIPELLWSMDAFVFPSLYEALGIVAIESQAAGLPTVVSEQIPSETYVTDFIKCENLDLSPKKWAKEIVKFSNKERKNTEKYITENGYDVKIETLKLQDFYLKLINN